MSELMFNRDPRKMPEVPKELFRQALKERKVVVHVICDPSTDDSAQEERLDFLTACDFLPRVGEVIFTQDGLECRVQQVSHQRVDFTENKGDGLGFALLPTVHTTYDLDELRECDLPPLTDAS